MKDKIIKLWRGYLMHNELYAVSQLDALNLLNQPSEEVNKS